MGSRVDDAYDRGTNEDLPEYSLARHEHVFSGLGTSQSLRGRAGEVRRVTKKISSLSLPVYSNILCRNYSSQTEKFEFVVW